MIKTIYPSSISGTVTAPPSKSMAQRAIAAGLLCKGTTTITNPSHCNDSIAALDMARSLGAEVIQGYNEVTMMGGFLVRNQHLNCGESGLAMRMFAPIASLHRKPITFNGKGSLTKRPVGMIEEALVQLGVEFTSNNGFLPFTVQGPLKGGKASIDGSISSQLLTGLLMSLPMAANDSEIEVNNLKSKPYVAMTLQLLDEFGISIENQNFEKFCIKGNQEYQSCHYTVEGDWSGAAFLLVAGAIAGEIQVQGLRIDSFQSDREILDVLILAGADLTVTEIGIGVNPSPLKAFRFDATECPDLFPPLAALAAHCEGVSYIEGVGRLTHKESNRAKAIQQEMRNIGIKVEIEGDEMAITGGKISGGNCHSHNDHRIAMMAAVCALTADKEIEISDAECVAKSYPAFYEHLERLGAIIGE